MKKLAKISSLLLLILIASCKKDNDTINVNQEDVEGTWNLTDVSCTDGTTTTTVDGAPPISGTFTVTGKNYNLTVTFNADGTYESQGSYTAVVTVKVQGITDVQESDSGFFEGTGTWSVSGNTLTANDGATTSTSTIEELTDTKMVIALKVDVTQEPIPGYSTTSKGTYRFTLNK